jgi:hypothetical protein
VSRRRAVLSLTKTALVLAAMALASCGGGSQGPNTPANSTPNDVIEGRFDVVRQRGVSTATEGGG